MAEAAPGQPVTEPARLAVLGHPIAHSASPALHAAAASALGQNWDYGRRDVREDELAAFVDAVRESWLGLSLTMPLKRAVIPLLDGSDRLSAELGVANTVRFDGGRAIGANTDVIGFERVLRGAAAHAVHGRTRALLLGSGATALSALAALGRVGVVDVACYARTPAHAGSLRRYAHEHGIALSATGLQDLPAVAPPEAIVVSALPPGAADHLALLPGAPANALLDVAYGFGEAPLVKRWRATGGMALDGTALLVEQALAQDAFFLTGDAEAPLTGLPRAREAMHAALRPPGH